MARPPSDIRKRALAAATEIACGEGGAALTIDAVARAAGVSKGGVLHHFPTKDQLIIEVVEAMIAAWEDTIARNMDNDPEPVGRFVRAFLDAMTDPQLVLIGRGLLAAVALNPALLEPLKESYRKTHKRIANDGLDPLDAYQCVFMADALWYTAIFDLPGPPEEVVSALRERLIASTRRRGR